MNGDRIAVEKLVAQHADVNAPQADGATALHWAVFQSDKAMLDLLIHAGANPTVANREGSTPLWLACINGNAPFIEALLKAGADANEKLPLGRTPLMVASRTGNVDAIQVLLDHGADVNAKETLRGTTALMWAADEGHAAAIQVLIQHGADIKAHSDAVERSQGRRSENQTIQEKRWRRRPQGLQPAYPRRNWAQLVPPLRELRRGRGVRQPEVRTRASIKPTEPPSGLDSGEEKP